MERPWRRTRWTSTSHIEKSHGGEGGENEMNVEDEGDREGSVTEFLFFAREPRENSYFVPVLHGHVRRTISSFPCGPLMSFFLV